MDRKPRLRGRASCRHALRRITPGVLPVAAALVWASVATGGTGGSCACSPAGPGTTQLNATVHLDTGIATPVSGKTASTSARPAGGTSAAADANTGSSSSSSQDCPPSQAAGAAQGHASTTAGQGAASPASTRSQPAPRGAVLAAESQPAPASPAPSAPAPADVSAAAAATTSAATTSAAPVATASGPPSLAIVKTERDATVGGGFVRGPLFVRVGDRIDYELAVTNTGPVPLVVVLDDPGCRIRGGATLHVEGIAFAPGQQLTYHCSHVVSSADGPAYRNTASASGTSATASVAPVSSSVVAHVAARVLAARKVIVRRVVVVRTVPKVVTRPAAPKQVAHAKHVTAPKHVAKVTKKATPAKPVVKRASFTG